MEADEFNYDKLSNIFRVKGKVKFDDKSEKIQIFSDKGIFAIMPCPAEKNGPTHTIVWSIDDEMLDNYEANQFLEDYLGYFEKKLETKIIIHSEVLSFKLSSHSFKSYVAGRKVLI